MRLGASAVSILVIAFSASPGAPGEKRGRDGERPTAKALAFFTAAEGASIAEFLGRLRPLPLSPAARARVIASLPEEGELRPTEAELVKLAALEPIVDFHGRKGALEIKVIEVGYAAIGLHARTVLLFSRDALALVTPEELQALAAHELGHEYLWEDYWTAMTTRADARRQELELVCDGIAVMTLRALGLKSAHLIDAVTKVTRYNERLGATASAGAYVSLKDRRRFIQEVATRLEAGDPVQAVRR